MHGTRTARVIFSALMMGIVTAAAAHAQETYPTRAVEIVVPFPPGGGTDIVGRKLAESLSEHLGQPFIVVNRPGAATNVGMLEVARSDPDGHKLLIGTRNVTTNRTLDPALPYDPMTDLRPVTMLTSTGVGMVVHPSLGVTTVDEFVEYAKARPGELNVAAYGVGSTPQLGAELFQQVTGTVLVTVMYEGANAARTAVLSNESQVLFTTTTSLMGDILDGRLVLLAVDGDVRPEQLPQVRTFREQGIEFELGSWFGLLAPAETPDEIVETLYEAARVVMNSAETQEFFEARGSVVVVNTPTEFQQFLRDEERQLADALEEIEQ